MPTVMNKRAPTVATDYDVLGGRDSMAEYYKLKLEEQRVANVMKQGFLSEGEKDALSLSSDLDILTTKILAKLKVESDYSPLLNTMRALTGHEDRADIARELATRHYNKSVTDHFVSKFVDIERTNNLLGFSDAASGTQGERSRIGGVIGTGGSWAGLKRLLQPIVGGGAGPVAAAGGE